MRLHSLRPHIEQILNQETGDGEVPGRYGVLIDGDMVTIELEVAPVPLVNMLDASILIENWPMEMCGESINVDVVLQTSFYPAEPNYDIDHVDVVKAKASDAYTDEDIGTAIKSDWNGVHAD